MEAGEFCILNHSVREPSPNHKDRENLLATLMIVGLSHHCRDRICLPAGQGEQSKENENRRKGKRTSRWCAQISKVPHPTK